MDGEMKSMRMDGGSRQMNRQDQVQDGGRRRAMRHLGKAVEPVGGFEVKNVEAKYKPKYIMHDRWCPVWLMLNYDSGAAVTALLVSVAGDLPLEKRGEFRAALGAVIPDMGKIKMMSTDESGLERSIRGHITEVAKPLLRCCGAPEEMGLSSLR